MLEIISIEGLIREANEKGARISDIVLEQQSEELGISKNEILERMQKNLQIMKEAVNLGTEGKISSSGMSGQASKTYSKSPNKARLLSGLVSNAIQKALAVSERNACMMKIVAAPTAGSCGILPAVLFSVGEAFNFTDDELTQALLNASGMCLVIAKNASVSGAEGGCQAECGSASAIAASAVVELMGGTPQMCAHALSFALKFVMGLVCDPVGGLVECPCVKRNASGAVNALVAAELALCGVESFIPADEVISAMKQVGDLMHMSLRETALGGLAATETAQKIIYESI